MEELKKNPYIVSSLDEKDRIRKAPAPFTTSSMQQDAANKINFSTRKTMMVAQQLYEGIEIKGHGTIGLVSYIRTGSDLGRSESTGSGVYPRKDGRGVLFQ